MVMAQEKNLSGRYNVNDQPNANWRLRRGPRCYQCNRYKHISRNCDKNRSEEGRNNADFSKVDKRVENKLYAAYSAHACAEDWFLDSGAPAHLCMNKSIFKNIRKSNMPTVTTANNGKMSANVGDFDLAVNVLDTTSSVEVNNVYYVPELKVNLLSIGQIVKKGNTVVFDDKFAKVFNKKKEIIASLVDNLFKLNAVTSDLLLLTQVEKTSMWHKRMAHLNFHSLKELSKGLVDGLDLASESVSAEICKTCIVGKNHHLPFSPSNSKTTCPLELVHSDVMGPMEVNFLARSRYVLTFLDDYSHKAFIYFLKTKDQVTEKFKVFKNYVETETGSKIKQLRTDNGGEYCNNSM